ncbi:hypothetical protein EVAR_26803_1 [Eumeta japonica]|uniref:Uncharacterized protein n=1 Tax=Eumeta variegata TaxID=151549 RepID=A0A4C1WG47_EUMVA|nr:hypothetical protein EVAR_26803_1 [Eumeta japonica]
MYGYDRSGCLKPVAIPLSDNRKSKHLRRLSSERWRPRAAETRPQQCKCAYSSRERNYCESRKPLHKLRTRFELLSTRPRRSGARADPRKFPERSSVVSVVRAPSERTSFVFGTYYNRFFFIGRKKFRVGVPRLIYDRSRHISYLSLLRFVIDEVLAATKSIIVYTICEYVENFVAVSVRSELVNETVALAAIHELGSLRHRFQTATAAVNDAACAQYLGTLPSQGRPPDYWASLSGAY